MSWKTPSGVSFTGCPSAEFHVLWEALAQYVENTRDAVEYGDAEGLDNKLAVAEKILARFETVVAKIANIEGAV